MVALVGSPALPGWWDDYQTSTPTSAGIQLETKETSDKLGGSKVGEG